MLTLLVQGSHLKYHFDTVTVKAIWMGWLEKASLRRQCLSSRDITEEERRAGRDRGTSNTMVLTYLRSRKEVHVAGAQGQLEMR